MVLGKERTPHERETLIFPTPEEARGWLERVGEQLRKEERPGLKRQRELIAADMAREFEKYGEGVGMIIRPWEHTPQEHEEVQKLVDVAFARDLPVALKQAQLSRFYPRNIDLFHDILTTEMYELVREWRLHYQPVWLTGLLVAGVAGLAAAIIFFLLLVY